MCPTYPPPPWLLTLPRVTDDGTSSAPTSYHEKEIQQIRAFHEQVQHHVVATLSTYCIDGIGAMSREHAPPNEKRNVSITRCCCCCREAIVVCARHVFMRDGKNSSGSKKIARQEQKHLPKALLPPGLSRQRSGERSKRSQSLFSISIRAFLVQYSPPPPHPSQNRTLWMIAPVHERISQPGVRRDAGAYMDSSNKK